MSLNSGESSSMDFSRDPRVLLQNLSEIQLKVDSVSRFLSESINRKTLINNNQMDSISSEISSAIHQIIVNGTSLLTTSENPKTQQDPDSEIVELDAEELLAEHIHFCEICGKGFKRDANLRMHMRAHGNQFKTLEALAKPLAPELEMNNNKQRRRRFSCPYEGCSRNKGHEKFKALKSVICVKNHFKRSHCPKMFACDRCNKKKFSVVGDLKSHLKHCGERKWRCSCGTSFSRKDKLFGHLGLFEGHMPAVEDDGVGKSAAVEAGAVATEAVVGEDVDFESFLDGFGSIENRCFQDVLGFSNDLDCDWAFL